jgi:hypothetical protein
MESLNALTADFAFVSKSGIDQPSAPGLLSSTSPSASFLALHLEIDQLMEDIHRGFHLSVKKE